MNSDISDTYLAQIVYNENLEHLNELVLNKCDKITDDFFDYIHTSPTLFNLEKINLSQLKITDKSIISINVAKPKITNFN